MIALLKPHMSDSEITLYSSILNESSRVLEFGSGNSTRWLIGKNLAKIESLETDMKIIENLEADPLVAEALKREVLKIRYVNIGEVGDWGFPRSKTSKEVYLNYTLNIWPTLDKDFNVVCIDGRFRLCTALLGLFYLPDAIFIFHDYLGRAYYYDLFPFIDIQDYASSMLVYKKKKNVQDEIVISNMIKHLFDAR